ncbi:hypothetical protein BU16DRAFT_577614 [Lophium mytilinum]|uniref:Flavin reductase like domain-containing protein n=1 Tax=Lophium mytilinum TaxID=390894 RepID=A0A6A6R9H7_9PEZI|nr:hypothetical protein BU16DRAFT_577614 [Lophium mytilinum]
MSTRAVAARRFFTAFYQWNNTWRKSPASRAPRACGQRSPSRRTVRAFSSSCPTAEERQDAIENQHATPQPHFRGVRLVTERTKMTETAPTSSVEPADPLRLRSLMRQVPQSVVVITSNFWDPEKCKVISQGMTVSSFNTVQMEPRPMISFNVRLPSKTYHAIKRPRTPNQFNVHILKNDPDGARIADSFTRGNDQHPFDLLEEAGVSVECASGDVPEINHESVIAVLSCSLERGQHARIFLDDHLVVVAEVKSIRHRDVDQTGLIYVNRAYAITALDQKKASPPKTLQEEDKKEASRPRSQQNRENRLRCVEQAKEKWNYYQLSTIPNLEERSLIRDRIREFVDECPELLSFRPSRAARIITEGFQLPAACGVNVPLVLHKRGSELGSLQPENKDWQSWQGYLGNDLEMYDFYGTVSADAVPIVAERVCRLFKNDPNASGYPRAHVLELCGAHRNTEGLPSRNLLTLARDAGLVPTSRTEQELNLEKVVTLELSERLEEIMRQSLSDLSPEKSKQLNEHTILEKIPQLGPRYHSRARLAELKKSMIREDLLESLPRADFDFYGPITSEQRPLLLERLLNAVLEDAQLQKAQQENTTDKLIRHKIHPGITGFDYQFVLQKFSSTDEKHLRAEVEAFRANQLKAWEREAEENWVFHGHLTPEKTEELFKSVQAYVGKDPSKAAELGVGGVLRAIGVQPNAATTYKSEVMLAKDNSFIKACIESHQPESIPAPSGLGESESKKTSSTLGDLARYKDDSDGVMEGESFMKYMTEDAQSERGTEDMRSEEADGQEAVSKAPHETVETDTAREKTVDDEPTRS